LCYFAEMHHHEWLGSLRSQTYCVLIPTFNHHILIPIHNPSAHCFSSSTTQIWMVALKEPLLSDLYHFLSLKTLQTHCVTSNSANLWKPAKNLPRMQAMVKGTTITRSKEPHFTFSQQNHITSGFYEDQIATNFIHCL
jgi:hypothetical protein